MTRSGFWNPGCARCRNWQNVSADGALPRPELQIRPRADEAARLGITAQQIAQTVRVATIGDVDAALPKISLDNRQIPIRVQASLDLRTDLAAIRALKVRTASGATVPLSSVADIDYAEAFPRSSATIATAWSPSARAFRKGRTRHGHGGLSHGRGKCRHPGKRSPGRER